MVEKFLYKTVSLFRLRDALDKAEKTTERLAIISKDVLKVFEMVNPKDHKRYQFYFYDITSCVRLKLVRIKFSYSVQKGLLWKIF